ncbi:similar to Saccharomyces cerevisiae YOR272W YTM1 Constituent of 66S pre-ribosomal particles [Maudiozyma saulgeensis]|uniref:Ribosome biogenesis protein YTM1 n=1 Tax=Maudiozyma saulgeensis TaxID=1789683 RepID=A0A1X7R4F0_9SACH|nr:similar to Saccharomyces cerevisiae YOR272W YTM1 Constituent of 66S pre-ribosomal particles [Kazachstania saulgeensis]
MSDDKSQVKIRFFTREKDESLQVQDTPMYVPIQLKRYGLSEIVNHLLSGERSDEDVATTPFDFLIDGQLLRSSLDDYLVKNGLSSEVALDIEYTRAVLPPSYLSSFSNEDWISSIDVTSGVEVPQRSIITGSYDGIVRTWNLSGQVEKMYSGHSAPIRAVKFVSNTRIVSAGNDRTLRIWKTKNSPVGSINGGEDADDELSVEEGKTLAILEGHSAPVVSLDVSTETSRIISASYDKSIGLWSTDYKAMNAVDPMEELNKSTNNKVSTAAKKRRKLALKDGSIRRRAPLSLLESHTAPVEQAIFDLNDNTVGYSVSQDHTIKTWDLVTARCVDTKTTSYSLLSIAQLSSLGLLACGSSARHITLHDPRADSSSSKITQQQLIGHKNFVVSLDTCPENEYMLCSGSHDGTVKVWDVRATAPMYTITRENGETKDKVFAVKWAEKVGIISGGEDKKVQINKGDNIFKSEQ